MTDIKSVMGVIIVALGVIALIFMLVSNALKLNLPRFFRDNHVEIALLSIVSCIMGLVLIIF